MSFFIVFYVTIYYKILSILPCVIQQVFVVYLLYIQSCIYVNPKLLIYLSLYPLLSPMVTMFIFYVCESISVLSISLVVSFLKKIFTNM